MYKGNMVIPPGGLNRDDKDHCTKQCQHTRANSRHCVTMKQGPGRPLFPSPKLFAHQISSKTIGTTRYKCQTGSRMNQRKTLPFEHLVIFIEPDSTGWRHYRSVPSHRMRLGTVCPCSQRSRPLLRGRNPERLPRAPI